MPEYDFRCDACARRFSVHLKTYAQYDNASLCCPACNSGDLTRLISSVSISRSDRDYGRLSSKEMLSVLESGEPRQVGELFKQVGGHMPVNSSSSDENSTDRQHSSED